LGGSLCLPDVIVPPRVQVAFAVDLITTDPKVKAILVNIFGGIVDCTIIAKGLIRAIKGKALKVPLVVRLEGALWGGRAPRAPWMWPAIPSHGWGVRVLCCAGTNVEQAKKLLAESGLPIIAAKNLDEAAAKAVAAI
jgi:succinyl-CoA synthetase beta subunit